jgi:hypothetical protein
VNGPGAVVVVLQTLGRISAPRTPSRIADIMDYIKERGWVNRPPKAKVI